MKRLGWGPLTIRVRMGAALAAALAPILVLGAAQSIVAVQRDADERRVILSAAAERSADIARARMQSAEAVLEAVTPQAVGFDCAPELRFLMRHLAGYANLARFDASGRVACAAANVGPDPGRANSAWFSSLRAGQSVSLSRAEPGAYAQAPAVIASVREVDQQGKFAGALSAVILLSSLKPDLTDRSLPVDTQLALASRDGNFLIRSDPSAFMTPPKAAFDEGASAPVFFKGKDAVGQTRIYAAAPLIGGVSVVLSAPTEGVFSWAKINPWSAVLLPLAAFFCALAAVWVVADQVAVRWLHYLDRVAAIYARGRFTVRPVKAASGPPEIQALAHSLAVMAEAIVARDLSLRESLAQKDALMREIHHRVKNNLQVISSLLNMQQRALSDPAARAAISDTRQRIGALALIYRALYQGPDLRRVDTRQFLEELIGLILTTESASHPSIKTDLEADALSIDPDKLAPLALFAVEAISNARKHAFAEGGVLHVRFHLVGESAVLEISDEGSKVGPAVIGAGVGRTLMTAFARQLRGASEITHNDMGGVTVRLTFPAPSVTSPEPSASGAQETPSPRRRAKTAA